MSDSVQTHRRPPTRLPQSLGFSRQEHWSGLPFPSPMHESEVTQSCQTLRDLMDCSLPGSSVHRIFQARVLEWGAIAFFGESMKNPIKSCPNCEMKISPAISINRERHSHQQFLTSRCEMRAPKTVIQRMMPPPNVIAAELGQCKKKEDWPQRAEVHMKGMDSVSPEACIFHT